MHQYAFTALAVSLFGSFLLIARRLLPHRAFSYALVAWGALILLFQLFGLAGRARLKVTGRVLSFDVRCVQPYNNRCVTTYELLTDSGTRTTYSAGPTDQALAHDIHVGARIEKLPWRFEYTVDGIVIRDFPWVPYLAFVGVGAIMVVRGGTRLLS
jgi:hypothetical protein